MLDSNLVFHILIAFGAFQALFMASIILLQGSKYLPKIKPPQYDLDWKTSAIWRTRRDEPEAWKKRKDHALYLSERTYV